MSQYSTLIATSPRLRGDRIVELTDVQASFHDKEMATGRFDTEFGSWSGKKRVSLHTPAYLRVKAGAGSIFEKSTSNRLPPQA